MGCAPVAPGTYSASQIPRHGVTTMCATADQSGPMSLMIMPGQPNFCYIQYWVKVRRNFKWKYFRGYLIQIKEMKLV